MPLSLRAALVAVIALTPAAALAQMVVEEPPMMDGSMMPMDPSGPLTEQDAADVAMDNGVMVIEEIELDDDGYFEVDGKDASGQDIEIDIDAETGAVLRIDS